MDFGLSGTCAAIRIRNVMGVDFWLGFGDDTSACNYVHNRNIYIYVYLPSFLPSFLHSFRNHLYTTAVYAIQRAIDEYMREFHLRKAYYNFLQVCCSLETLQSNPIRSFFVFLVFYC